MEADNPMPDAPSKELDSARSDAKKDSNKSNEQRGQKRKRGGFDKDRGNKSGNRGRPDRRPDLGREQYFRSNPDRRQRNEVSQVKRQKLDEDGEPSAIPRPFSKDEIAAEDRKPKRKVAVMLGYSGSGYKGMQIMPDQKTIEGDLFNAFIAAGAISKANADDPKKSSFVRCARTDKGVHAAGNVISLKLIIEDPDIVKKINDNLSPQIRVWGFERTTGSFSCYQACDSRWYEYLIPTHCFLPPHPQSFMAQKLSELATEVDDLEGYHSRQAEVKDFWAETDRELIQPILDGLDEETRKTVEEVLYRTKSSRQAFEDVDEDAEDLGDEATGVGKPVTDVADDAIKEDAPAVEEEPLPKDDPAEGSTLEAAIKTLKTAYIKAKEAYRIDPIRLERVREAFDMYKGTNNYHNFTVRKSPKDPSAQRNIMSFKVASEPIIINSTEWLSLKVHGQSFMMHQIRKMVGLAALVVRCGSPLSRIRETLGTDLYSIPKAPGLGLLLERPVFNNYNASTAAKFNMNKIEFTEFEKEMDEFKAREIYDRIFREEDKDHLFHSFFTHIDHFKEPTFLFLSSKGIQACGSVARTASNIHQPSRKERKNANRSFKHERVARGGGAESQDKREGSAKVEEAEKPTSIE